MSSVGPANPQDIFTNNERWADVDDWNRSAMALHEEGGIHRIEREGFSPFWAVIDHTALVDIEREAKLFANAPEPVLTNDFVIANRPMQIKTLIHTDAPLHTHLRKLTSDWFKPSSIRRMNDRLDTLSQSALQKMRSMSGRCDFAVDIAMPFPLQVILGILGLPEEDYERMLILTQQLFGQEDPDLRRGDKRSGAAAEVITDFYNYFAGITADRRANPTDDLASVIANGRIDGELLPDLETMGYYIIVATAGHDTTSSAMAGGLQALIENPDQLALLQARPELMANAVEEIIRWTSPVRHFMRTAQEDTEVLGQKIRKGDWLYLSYKAANLDPKVFEDPLRFDIERSNADRQVSFGYGVHFCLGAQLARNEIRSLFTHVVPRLETVELAGDPATMKTTFVGGHKTLPIRYSLT